VIDSALVRLVFPITVVGLALQGQKQGWGVLGLVNLPFWVEVGPAYLL